MFIPISIWDAAPHPPLLPSLSGLSATLHHLLIHLSKPQRCDITPVYYYTFSIRPLLRYASPQLTHLNAATCWHVISSSLYLFSTTSPQIATANANHQTIASVIQALTCTARAPITASYHTTCGSHERYTIFHG